MNKDLLQKVLVSQSKVNLMLENMAARVLKDNVGEYDTEMIDNAAELIIAWTNIVNERLEF